MWSAAAAAVDGAMGCVAVAVVVLGGSGDDVGGVGGGFDGGVEGEVEFEVGLMGGVALRVDELGRNRERFVDVDVLDLHEDRR